MTCWHFDGILTLAGLLMVLSKVCHFELSGYQRFVYVPRCRSSLRSARGDSFESDIQDSLKNKDQASQPGLLVTGPILLNLNCLTIFLRFVVASL